MKKGKLNILISLMTFALLGLITIQIFWSIKTIETEEMRFNATINKVLSNVVVDIEKNRTANIIIEKVSGEKGNVVWVENNTMGKDSNKFVFFSSSDDEHELIKDGRSVKINVEVTENDEEANKHQNTEVRVLKKFVKLDPNKKQIKEIRKHRIDTFSVDKEHLISEVLEDMVSFKKEKYLETDLKESLVDSLIKIELKENGLDTEFYFGIKKKGDEKFISMKSGAETSDLLITRYERPLSPHEVFSNQLQLKLHIPNSFGLILKSIWFMFSLSLLFILVIIFVYIKTVKMFLEQKKVVEVKNDLINNITHEFKTPISAISLASEALKEPKLIENKDSIKRYSKIITEENLKLTQLVETLLNTAEFEESEIELNLEQIEIDSIIYELVEKTKIRFPLIKLSYENFCENSVLSQIDIFHFTNIINNLIDNAIKYSREVVDISIKLEQVDEGLELTIADKGIGVSKNNQPKIFDTFYRVQTGNIHDVKGNGIGLSYVRRIIEAHKGTVRVESKLNVGSKFIIFLPKIARI